MNDPVFHGDLALLEKLSGDALTSLYLARRAAGPVMIAAVPAKSALPQGGEAAYLDTAGKLQGMRGTGLLAALHAQGGARPAVAYALFNGVALSVILDKSRQDGVPMAADLALLVAEKVAESLKQLPPGLRHTLVSAECVLISFEGEVAVVDAPLAAALAQLPVTEAMAGETRFARLHRSVQAGKPSPRAEIWQLGAMLLEMVSGEPFTTRGDIAQKIVQQCNAQEIGADIREVIERALVENSDAYRSIDEFREAAGKLIYQGAYSPSTFNLAFFMHTLYRGEDEIRADKVKSLASLQLQFPAAAVAPPAPAVAAAPPKPAPKARPAPVKAPSDVPTFDSVTGNDSPPPPPLDAAPRAGLPIGLIAGGAILLLALLGGGFAFMKRGQSEKDRALAELQEKQLKLQQENEKLQVAAHEADDLKAQKAAADQAALDARSAEERKKAEDEQARIDAKLKAAEERRRVQEEAVKKQTDVVQTAETRKPAPARPVESKSPPAAAGASAAKPAPVESAPVAVPAPAPEPPPVAEPVKEVYTAAEVDSPPKLRDDLQPEYPSRGRGNAVVILRLTVDAAGAVVNSEIAKSDDGGYGFNEAALAAAKKLRYAPAIKDGRPVKCTVAKTYKFKGQI